MNTYLFSFTYDNAGANTVTITATPAEIDSLVEKFTASPHFTDVGYVDNTTYTPAELWAEITDTFVLVD